MDVSELAELYSQAHWGKRVVVVSYIPGIHTDLTDEDRDNWARVGVSVVFTNLNRPAGYQLIQLGIDPDRDYIIFYGQRPDKSLDEALVRQRFVFEFVEGFSPDKLVEKLKEVLSNPAR